MGEDFQAELASLTPAGAAADEAVEATFDHRDDGFYLDAIAIGSCVEARVCMSRR